MPTESQADYISQLLRDRYGDYKQALDIAFSALVRGKEPQMVATANDLISAAQDFEKVLTPKRRPTWLIKVIQAGKSWIANTSELSRKNKFYTAVSNARVQSVPISYADDDVEVFINVDAVYEQIRDEHQLTVLFDKLIDAIKEIVSLDQVDSIRVRDGLREILRLLEVNKSGSFAASWYSILMSRRFYANVLVEYSKTSKVAGPLIKAFETTQTQLENKFSEIKDELEDAVWKPLEQRVPQVAAPTESELIDDVNPQVKSHLPSPKAKSANDNEPQRP